MKNSWIGPACAGFVVAVTACAQQQNEAELVATVGEYQLTVDQVVDLLVNEERLVADAQIVRTLADYWIDYTLLAEAAAEDSTFRRLDLEPLVEQQLWQTMVFQLRDSVIQVDTFLTEDELRELYESEEPELRIRARHIMLTYPFQATPAQRDSVRGVLQGLRERIVRGESFEALAAQYSRDPGSAPSGGDLGFFRRGDMVAPFEAATLALQPGGLSEVVETPMGIHLIRLEERVVQGFEEAAPQFRTLIQGQRVQEAESTFVAAIEQRVEPELADGAIEVTRELARNPGSRLSGRAGRRPVVEWEGGAVTVGQLLQVLQLESAALRAQLVQEDDENIDIFLRDLARRELLIEEARSAGLQVPRSRVDSLVANAGDQLRSAARMLGLLDLDQAPGEPRELAIARTVEEALTDNLTGATQFVPLGMVGFQLRERTSSSLHDAGIGQAIVRIVQLRTGRSPSPLESALDTVPPAADTVGP